MTTTAGVGNSKHPDPALAGECAMRAALRDLNARAGDVPIALALAFATTGYDQQALVDALNATLRHAVGNGGAEVPLFGCSVEGTITSDGSCEDACSVAVMLIVSPGLELCAHGFELGRCHEQLAADFTDWLQDRQRDAPTDTRELVILMADGLSTCVANMLEVLDHVSIGAIPIVGGLAGDRMAFDSTWVYVDGEARKNAAVALHLRGRFVAEIGIAHGCEPVGLPMRVTSSDGHELVELDGRPAWDVVREYVDLQTFDGLTSSLVSLSIQRDESSALVMRSPFALDRSSGALRFTGSIPQGSLVHLTRRNARTIRFSAERCAREIRDRHPGRHPALVVQFDCAHRGRIVLGTATSLILVSAVRCILGTATPWIGGHTYAEIAPVDGRPSFHNFSVVLLALYDL